MWFAFDPIARVLPRSPLARLLDPSALVRAWEEETLHEGFRVIDSLSLPGMRRSLPPLVPAARIAVRRLALAGRGRRVALVLAVYGAGFAFPDEGQPVTGLLNPARARRRLRRLLAWPAGQKVLLVSSVVRADGMADVTTCLYGCRPASQRRHRKGTRTPGKSFPIEFARVVPEAAPRAQEWFRALELGSEGAAPVARLVGFPPGQWAEGAGQWPAAMQWLNISAMLCYLGAGSVGVKVGVWAAPSAPVENALPRARASQISRAFLAVARAWPGGVVLERSRDRAGRLQFTAWLGMPPEGPEAGRVLALAALRDAVRGTPEHELGARLRAVWSDPSRVRALSVLAGL